MPESVLRPPHFLMAWFAMLQNRRLMQESENLRAEVRVLRRALGKRSLLLAVDERRELADKAKALVLGRKALAGLVSNVTADTVLRWHRELVRAKWAQASATTRASATSSSRRAADIEWLGMVSRGRGLYGRRANGLWVVWRRSWSRWSRRLEIVGGVLKQCAQICMRLPRMAMSN